MFVAYLLLHDDNPGTVENPLVDWDGAFNEIQNLMFSQLIGDVPAEEAEGYEGYWKTKLLTAAKKSVQQIRKNDPKASIPMQTHSLPWEDGSNEG